MSSKIGSPCMVVVEQAQNHAGMVMAPCEIASNDGSDDEDGSNCPPSAQKRRRGGTQIMHKELPAALMSSEGEVAAEGAGGGGIGFHCDYDLKRSEIHAKFVRSSSQMSSPQRNLKLAIVSLLDLAEAHQFQRIILGLPLDQSADRDVVCTFLDLGFEFIPYHKSPAFGDACLFLDFITGYDGGQNIANILRYDESAGSESECSTSAEEEYEDDPDTDSSLGKAA